MVGGCSSFNVAVLAIDHTEMKWRTQYWATISGHCARPTDFIKKNSDDVPVKHSGDVAILATVRNNQTALQMDGNLSGLIFSL